MEVELSRFQKENRILELKLVDEHKKLKLKEDEMMMERTKVYILRSHCTQHPIDLLSSSYCYTFPFSIYLLYLVLYNCNDLSHRRPALMTLTFPAIRQPITTCNMILLA